MGTVLLMVTAAAAGCTDDETQSPPVDAGGVTSGCEQPEARNGADFYLATDGSDDSGDGSSAAPWATITHALDNVPDDSTILVRPGLYSGRVRVRGSFPIGVTVRSEQRYRAMLRNNGLVVSAYESANGCEGITLEGFDIAHDGPNLESDTVIHFGGNGDGVSVSRLTLRDNVIHDSYDNDLIKISHGLVDITIERNMFYNQTGADEHLDINSVKNVIVQDNIFFNDFAGSGRTNGNDTSSYVLVKDSAEDDVFQGSQSIIIRRNVFVNWEGDDSHAFVRMTESGGPIHEAVDVMVENNLLLGNAANDIRAAFGVTGGRDIVFRNNTVSGDLPARSFAMLLLGTPPNENIQFYNNIWADPTGTMGADGSGSHNDFSDTAPEGTLSFELDHNLYWNAGQAIPEDDQELVNYTDDVNRVVSDPILSNPADVVVPRWDAAAGAFADGSATIVEAFERLVNLYGAIGSGSGAADAADPAKGPAEDILCRPRGPTPDIGAYEAP